jgi:hypothetical protein
MNSAIKGNCFAEIKPSVDAIRLSSVVIGVYLFLFDPNEETTFNIDALDLSRVSVDLFTDAPIEDKVSIPNDASAALVNWVLINLDPRLSCVLAISVAIFSESFLSVLTFNSFVFFFYILY